MQAKDQKRSETCKNILGNIYSDLILSLARIRLRLKRIRRKENHKLKTKQSRIAGLRGREYVEELFKDEGFNINIPQTTGPVTTKEESRAAIKHLKTYK